jgi:hypothetical protein
MKRMVGFVILVLAALVYVPRIAAQSSEAAIPGAIVFPKTNNWLSSYWYCDPAEPHEQTEIASWLSRTALLEMAPKYNAKKGAGGHRLRELHDGR